MLVLVTHSSTSQAVGICLVQSSIFQFTTYIFWPLRISILVLSSSQLHLSAKMRFAVHIESGTVDFRLAFWIQSHISL